MLDERQKLGPNPCRLHPASASKSRRPMSPIRFFRVRDVGLLGCPGYLIQVSIEPGSYVFFRASQRSKGARTLSFLTQAQAKPSLQAAQQKTSNILFRVSRIRSVLDFQSFPKVAGKCRFLLVPRRWMASFRQRLLRRTPQGS